MGNCLVTKLKESVNADLPKVDELVLNVKSGSFKVRAISGKSFVVRANKAILSSTDGGPYSTEVTITNPGGSSTMYTIYITEDSKVYISNKYTAIGRVEGSGIIGDLDLNYCSISNLGQDGYPHLDTLIIGGSLTSITAEVKHFVIPENYVPGTLTTLIFSTSSIANELTTAVVAEKLPNVQTLQGSLTNFLSGSMANLGACTSLSVLRGGEYTGNFEDFVAIACKASTPRTTGDVAISYAGRVKFNGANVTSSSTVKHLTWQPSSDNISVSYDGSTTVIHVASDGSWTRVS